MKSSKSIISTIIGLRIFLMLLFVLLIGFSVPGLFRLNVTVNLDDYFLADDPVLGSQKDFENIFPAGNFVGVLVEAPDTFSRDSLELIREIGEVLRTRVTGAGGVTSLTGLDGSLTGGHSLRFNGSKLISTSGEIEALREAAADSPLLNGTLFSSDYHEAWVLLTLDEDSPGVDDLRVGGEAWNALDELDTGSIRLTASGVPVVAYRKQAELTEDLIRVLLIAGLGAVFLSAIVLRSIQGVIGTLGVFTGSVIIVLGIQGWFGTTVDSGFIGVPILLTMGVSIGYSVHVHRFFRMEFSATGKRRSSVVSALSRTIRPIFFTALTTIAALISFIFVDVGPIRWVGFTSAWSIVAAFALCVLFFPSFLSYGRDAEPGGRLKEPRFLHPLFRWTARVCDRRMKTVILIFLLTAILAAIGTLRLNVDFDAVAMMGTRLPHMQDQVHVGESEIAVGEYMNLLVSLPDEGFRSADAIRGIADLENRISDIPGVRRASSIITVLREVNSLMHQRDPDFAGLPENNVSLQALLRLVNGVMPEESRNWLDDSGGHARLFVEVSDFSSRSVEKIIDEILPAVEASFPEGVSVSVSGSTYQVAMMNQYITRGLLQSIGTALLTISVIMILVYRSLRWGLVAMIPNVFPVLVAGGILGFAGIPLEFVTMTVAPIVLGLAVDDTIHFMSFLKDDLPGSPSFRSSLERSFESVGAAITETTVILCISFLIFTVSRVNSIRYMGVIAAAGMLAAYLADLLVVPVLVRMLTDSEK